LIYNKVTDQTKLAPFYGSWCTSYTVCMFFMYVLMLLMLLIIDDSLDESHSPPETDEWTTEVDYYGC